jgi:hypothetical protein
MNETIEKPDRTQIVLAIQKHNGNKQISLYSPLGGAQIRWNDSQQGYATVAGDRYISGDVEDVVAGLLKMQQR